MATAGSGHQHGVKGLWPRGAIGPHHRGEAGHEGAGELAGVAFLSLVMGDGAAAALIGGDHHFNAIGAEHLDRRQAHRRIKQPLHAAQQQPHPMAPLPVGRQHHGQVVSEGFRWQGGQEPFQRRDLGAEQAGQAGPSHQ